MSARKLILTPSQRELCRALGVTSKLGAPNSSTWFVSAADCREILSIVPGNTREGQAVRKAVAVLLADMDRPAANGTQAVLFDTPEAAREARIEAIAQVAETAEPWMEKALDAVRFVSLAPEFLMEEVRAALVPVVGQPHHPNAWGAFTNALLKRRLIEETGEWRAAQAKGSNGRRMPVYRRP